MKKQLLILLAVLGVAISAKASFSPDGTQLLHTWNLQWVVIAETPMTPDEALEDDMFSFLADNTFTAVIEGVNYTGTYGVDVTNTWITLYISDDHAERYKIISMDATALKVQKFDSEGNIMTYIFQNAD